MDSKREADRGGRPSIDRDAAARACRAFDRGTWGGIPAIPAMAASLLLVAGCSSATRTADGREDSGPEAGLDGDGEGDGSTRPDGGTRPPPDGGTRPPPDGGTRPPPDAEPWPDAGPDGGGPDSGWPDVDPGPDPLEVLSYLDPHELLDVFVVGDWAYVVGFEEALETIDVSDRTAPRVVGGSPWDEGGSLWVAGGYAYVAIQHGGVRVFDVRDPRAPSQVVYHRTPGEAEDVVVDGARAYVAAGYEGLRILDVSDPASPRELGFWILTGQATHVAVSGGLVFVAGTDNLLRVLDVSDPAAPVELSTANLPEAPRDLEVGGGIAWVSTGPAGLRIVDVGDPRDATNIGSWTPRTCHDCGVQRLALDGTTLFVATREGSLRRIVALDVTAPRSPVALGSHRMVDDCNALFVAGPYLYAVEEHRGLTIFARR